MVNGDDDRSKPDWIKNFKKQKTANVLRLRWTESGTSHSNFVMMMMLRMLWI